MGKQITGPTWTKAEMNVLLNLYNKIGAKGVHQIIPGRSVSAIKNMAAKWGVMIPNSRTEEKVQWEKEVHEGNRHVYRMQSRENKKREEAKNAHRKVASQTIQMRSPMGNASLFWDGSL